MSFGIFMTIIWVGTIIAYAMYNLYRKNVKLESIVISQANFIAGLQALIGESEKAIKNLDDKIWLESDKELQQVFHNLRAIQEGLNQFNKK